MEKINFSVNFTHEQLAERRTLADQLKQSPRVQAFINKYDVSDTYFLNHVQKFADWLQTVSLCDGCKGLAFCRQPETGIILDLQITPIIQNVVAFCDYKLEEKQSQQHLSAYRINDLSTPMSKVSLNDLNLEEEKGAYLDSLHKIIEWVENPAETGFYLYGHPGVGKTHLAACVSNYFAKKEKSVAFVHYPSFVQRMKNSFDDSEFIDQQLAHLKNVYFLVLDDIGAESVTSWTRDELLFPILNSRMEEKRATWFTSNDDFSSLKNHFMYNQRQDKEEMKAVRIMERIETLTKPLLISGKNRRKE